VPFFISLPGGENRGLTIFGRQGRLGGKTGRPALFWKKKKRGGERALYCRSGQQKGGAVMARFQKEGESLPFCKTRRENRKKGGRVETCCSGRGKEEKAGKRSSFKKGEREGLGKTERGTKSCFYRKRNLRYRTRGEKKEEGEMGGTATILKERQTFLRGSGGMGGVHPYKKGKMVPIL